jgi:hypothetical protein
MTEEEANNKFWQAVDSYVADVQAELRAHVQAWKTDLAQTEVHEVVGAILARQVTLSVQLAKAPQIWNGHVAPLVLRSIVDAYIALAWILQNPLERARLFIMYGLGQDKLILEHHKAQLLAEGKKPEENAYIKNLEDMLNSQRFTFLTEVNVGSWSGHDVRRMADESGCLDLYRFAYVPFSAPTHSMWNHLVRYNLRYCTNPLHRYHRIPVIRDDPSSEDYLYRASKYVAKTFNLFREKTVSKPEVKSAFKEFRRALIELAKASAETDKLDEGQ